MGISFLFDLIFGGFKKLFDLVSKYPWQAALITAGLFIGWQFSTINDLTDSRNFWEERAAEEKANHKLTKVNFQKTKDGYRLAVKKANKDFAAEIDRIETQWKGKANVSEINYDRDLAAALDSMRSALRSGRGGAGAQSVSGKAQGSQTPAAPRGPSGTDSMPELVATRPDDEDLYICTVNTVKALNFKSLYESLQVEPARPDFPADE